MLGLIARYMTEPARCPKCNSRLEEKVEFITLKSSYSGSNISMGSLDAYYGSVEFFSAPDSIITIKYLKCSNPECGYLFRKPID